MLRALFILFLTLNLLALIWQWLTAPEGDDALLTVAQPVDNRLHLADGHRLARPSLSDETDPGRAVQEWRPEGCLHLGGIDDPDALRAVAHRLGIADPELITDVEREVVAWWVILPPEAVDDEDDLQVSLDDEPVGDHFFIRSGDASGGVSFGLFSLESRAEDRLSALQSLGYEVEIRPRWEENRRYWFAIPLGLPFDMAMIAPDLVLTLRPALCPDDRPSLVGTPVDPIE